MCCRGSIECNNAPAVTHLRAAEQLPSARPLLPDARAEHEDDVVPRSAQPEFKIAESIAREDGVWRTRNGGLERGE